MRYSVCMQCLQYRAMEIAKPVSPILWGSKSSCAAMVCKFSWPCGSGGRWFMAARLLVAYDIAIVVLHGLLAMSCNNSHSELTAWCCSHTQSVLRSLPFLLSRFVLTNSGSAERPADHSWDSNAEPLHRCCAENILLHGKLQIYNLKSEISNPKFGIWRLESEV